MTKKEIEEMRRKIKDKEYMKKAIESIANRILSGEISLRGGKDESD